MSLNWLAQSLISLEAQLVVAFTALALFLCWLLCYSPLAPAAQRSKGVMPAFITIPTTIFALMVTFLAQDIWAINRHARRYVGLERESLLTLRALSMVTSTSDVAIRNKINEYVEAVVGVEWNTMETGSGAAEARAALDELMQLVAVHHGDNPELERAIMDTVMKIRSAREQRLVIANALSDDKKWMTVLLMAFLSQIGLALGHIDNPRGQLLAQTVFGVAATLSLSLIAAYERPFVPPYAVSAAPLAEVLSLAGPPD